MAAARAARRSSARKWSRGGSWPPGFGMATSRLTVATQNADGSSHDWLDDVLAFEVVDARALAGVANLRAQIAWQKKPAAQERALR